MQTLRFKVIITFDPYKYCFVNKRAFLRFEGGVSLIGREPPFVSKKGSPYGEESLFKISKEYSFPLYKLEENRHRSPYHTLTIINISS